MRRGPLPSPRHNAEAPRTTRSVLARRIGGTASDRPIRQIRIVEWRTGQPQSVTERAEDSRTPVCGRVAVIVIEPGRVARDARRRNQLGVAVSARRLRRVAAARDSGSAAQAVWRKARPTAGLPQQGRRIRTSRGSARPLGPDRRLWVGDVRYVKVRSPVDRDCAGLPIHDPPFRFPGTPLPHRLRCAGDGARQARRSRRRPPRWLGR